MTDVQDEFTQVVVRAKMLGRESAEDIPCLVGRDGSVRAWDARSCRYVEDHGMAPAAIKKAQKLAAEKFASAA